jgi:hypothetical protein
MSEKRFFAENLSAVLLVQKVNAFCCEWETTRKHCSFSCNLSSLTYQKTTREAFKINIGRRKLIRGIPADLSEIIWSNIKAACEQGELTNCVNPPQLQDDLVTS